MKLFGKLAVLCLIAASLLAQAPAPPAAGTAREPGLYATMQTNMGPEAVRKRIAHYGQELR
jgi:hypothetical protein